MRYACWVAKDTNIHSEYAMFIAFTLQQQLYERASLLNEKCIAHLFTVTLH